MNTRQSQIIIKPLLNEKSIGLTEMNQYTFEVARDATKCEIKQALELILAELYPSSKHKVVKVNTTATRGRFRARRRHGRAPHDGKKAIVTIEGDPVELFKA